MKFAILIIAILFFNSCGEGPWEKYERRKSEEREKFETNTSERQRELVNDFFKGNLKVHNRFKSIDGGFYCLWKRRSEDIAPHMSVIDKLKENGYTVTTNKDSLDYIVISESIANKVGSYSNGGDATRLDIHISLIDTKNGTAYKIKEAIGGPPPSSISRKAGSKTGSVGSFFDEKQIYNFLTNQVIEK